MRAIEGEQVVFGANSVVNKGKVSAVLNDARLLGGTSDDGADVREVRVIDLGEAPGTGDLLGAGKWPDRSWKRWWSTAQPIAGGVELPAGHAAELVFILDIKQTGEWVWPQTALDYEVGDDPYTAITNFGFQVCPPSPAECSQLSGSDSS
jgi:hypothetical protein